MQKESQPDPSMLPLHFLAEDVHIYNYLDAPPAITYEYISHVQNLGETRRLKEIGHDHLKWVMQQLKHLEDASAPFGVYLITFKHNGKQIYGGAFGIAFDDYDLGKDYALPGDGFWGRFVIPTHLYGTELLRMAFQYCHDLSQSHANTKGESVRFNLITASDSLAEVLIDTFDFVDTKEEAWVRVLEKVRLLYKVFEPNADENNHKTVDSTNTTKTIDPSNVIDMGDPISGAINTANATNGVDTLGTFNNTTIPCTNGSVEIDSAEHADKAEESESQ